MIEASIHVATVAQRPLATAAINRKVDWCADYVSDTASDGLNGKKFCDLLCVLSYVVIVRVVDTKSRN